MQVPRDTLPHPDTSGTCSLLSARSTPQSLGPQGYAPAFRESPVWLPSSLKKVPWEGLSGRQKDEAGAGGLCWS